MPNTELVLLTLAAAGAAVGGWSILLARGVGGAGHVRWGQRLCLSVLVVLGLATMLAAWWRAYALAPLGLCTGLLLVASVFEPPLQRRPAQPQ